MAWTQVFQDTFGRADGAVGNSWDDVASAWSISAGKLTSTNTSFGTAFLERPAGESLTDQRVAMECRLGNINSPLIWLAKTDNTATGYVIWSGDGPNLYIGEYNAGSLNIRAQVSHSIPNNSDVVIDANFIPSTGVVSATIALQSTPGTTTPVTWTDPTPFASGIQGLSPIFNPSSVTKFTVYSQGSPAPTSYTLTGPSSGNVNVASTNFSVSLNGTPTGSITVTPASSGAGTFSPTSLTWTAGDTSTKTFTYTPTTTVGSPHSISATNTGGLTNPSAISYAVTVGASISLAPSSVNKTGGFVEILVTGTGTSWIAGTPGSPSFTVSAGTIITQTILSATSAKLYYGPPKTGASATISDGTNSATLTLTSPTTTYKVVCAGNSLTAGDGSSGGNTYPAQLSTRLGAFWSVQNSGVSGQTGATILANYSSQIGTYYDGSKTANVAVVWEIINDLYFGASTTTTYNNIVAICNAAKATGYKVVVVTGTGRAQSPPSYAGTDGEKLVAINADIAAVNALIRANWRAFADGIADLAKDERYYPPGSTANSAVFADVVHFNNAGYGYVADEIAAAVWSAIIQPASSGGSTYSIPRSRLVNATR